MSERYTSSETPVLAGKFTSGATVTITIIKLSDESVVVNAAACDEVGATGFFKYTYTPVSGYAEYLWTMTDGTNEVAGSFVISAGADTPDAGTDTADIIDAIEALTPLSVQDYDEYIAGTNTTAKILYNSASRTQGNFSIFYAQAVRVLARDLTRHNLQLSSEEQPIALAYLIWDLAIKKFPDWEAQTVSPGGSESVTRAKPGQTSAKAAYLDILKGSKRRVGTTPEIGHLDDYTNYPENMHPCPIDHERLAGDDY